MGSRLTRPTSVENVLQALSKLVDELETMEAWREVAFQNSWATVGGGVVETAAFYKDALGIVHIRGGLAGPAGAGTGNATVAFTLPEGYRPAGPTRIGTTGTTAAGGGFPGRIDISTSGTVVPILHNVAANAAVESIAIYLSFRAA